MPRATIRQWALDDPRRTPVRLRGELIAAGYTDRALAQLTRSGVLGKPRRGAYVDGPALAGLDEAGRHAVRTRAVLQQARTAVVASHVSSAVEYDAPTWGLPLDATHVTRLDGEAGRREAGVQQHCGRIVDGDVVIRNGISVMSATRTALEVTTTASVEPGLVVANHLLHQELTTPDALDARYRLAGGSMERWPHSLSTDVVLRLADPRIESVGETRTYFLCFRHGIPMPEPQVEVVDANGVVVARVDFAWPRLGAFLEFDGRVKYQKLLGPDEDATDVVLREKKREELICRLTGWKCIRITWGDLARPAATAAYIRQSLAAASVASRPAV